MTDSANSRHAGDIARVSVGLAVLLVAALAVRRAQLSQFETDLFRLINHLPSTIEPVVVVFMQAGNVVAAPILGVVVVFLTASGCAWPSTYPLPAGWRGSSPRQSRASSNDLGRRGFSATSSDSIT